MKVPFIDLKRLTSLVKAPALAAWEQAVDNTEFVGGPSVLALEKVLGEKLGATQAITCGSGTDALLVALRALGVGPGKKVALPNLTFWATYEAVTQLGATPVLVEVDPRSLQMSFCEFKRVYEDIGFDAGILVHLMGWASSELSNFRDFCGNAKIPLLEDGAQSYGVEVQGKSVYAGAQVSTLSFYPAKVVGGCMNGGAILTDDPAMAALIRKLCNHGRTSHYSYSHVGWNSRMGGLQASWLLEVLRHDREIVRQRREMESAYLAAFAELEDFVTAYGPPRGVAGNGYLSVCTLKKHSLETVTSKLSAAGIGCGRVYPETLDMQPPAFAAIRSSDLSIGKGFCKSVLNLPLFYGMTWEEFDYVKRSFEGILREGS